MLYTILLVFHVIVSILLILVILIQPGKGDGLGALTGGGSSAVFGGRGAMTFLHKLTTALAILFFLLSVGIAISSGERTVIEGKKGGGTTKKEEKKAIIEEVIIKDVIIKEETKKIEDVASTPSQDIISIPQDETF